MHVPNPEEADALSMAVALAKKVNAAVVIDDLCVDEACRGKHVGQALYGHTVAYAREIGCRTVTLNVWCGNDSAMKFYESRGLKQRNIHMEARL